MSVENMLFSEETYYLTDTLYRQTIKEIVISMGKKLIRPSMHTSETFSGMDGFLNMTGKLSHRRRYGE